MDNLLSQTAQKAAKYLRELDTRPVFPSSAVIENLKNLDGAFPENPTEPETVLTMLDQFASPATVASAGRRYYGFVTGGSLPAALAANWLAGAWDNNTHLMAGSPAAVALEEISLRWLLEALHLPSESGAAFVTGATMANFSALAAARHHVLEQAGWDVEANGLFGAPEITVIVGEEAHSTLFKALGLLGFGRNRVIKVPVDEQGRMRVAAFPKITGPAIVCIQAGNVNTGSFDPASDICRLAHESGAWVHVDGAFGLWAAAAPARAYLVEGVEQADSWATDAHKWLNVPYDSGLAFVRKPETLRAAMSLSAAYLPTGDKREPMMYTPESSRRSRGVEIWAALKSLGKSGLSDLIERNCRYASRFSEGLKEAGFEILNEVVLNQVLVDFGGDAETRRVVAGVQEEGTCWAGLTNWQGRAAMRISVSSWATTADDVEKSLLAIVKVATRR
jgi:glutamate/tyrosine decarboxylase-like PLP-dependent enzyme